jgi:hypothetical protein
VQLTVRFLRKSSDGSATQKHTYSFHLTSSSFTVASDLSRARVSTGDQMGKYGRVSMTFHSGNTGFGEGGPCVEASGVKGSLSGPAGSFMFHSHTKYFGTVQRRSFAATLERRKQQTGGSCAKKEQCRNELALASDRADRHYVLSALKNTKTGSVMQLFVYTPGGTAPARVTRQIDARGGTFTASATLKGGHLQAPSNQPFLSGALDFEAPSAQTISGTGCTTTVSQGYVTGGYAAHFDVAGKRSYTDGHQVAATMFRSKTT